MSTFREENVWASKELGILVLVPWLVHIPAKNLEKKNDNPEFHLVNPLVSNCGLCRFFASCL